MDAPTTVIEPIRRPADPTPGYRIANPRIGHMDLIRDGKVIATARRYRDPQGDPAMEAWVVAYGEILSLYVDYAASAESAATALLYYAEHGEHSLSLFPPTPGYVVYREIVHPEQVIAGIVEYRDKLPSWRHRARALADRNIAEINAVGPGGRLLLEGEYGQIIHTAAEAEQWVQRCTPGTYDATRVAYMDARESRLWARARRYRTARLGDRVDGMIVRQHAWTAETNARVQAATNDLGQPLPPQELAAIRGLPERTVLTADGGPAILAARCDCGSPQTRWIRAARWGIDRHLWTGDICPIDRKVTQTD